MIPKKSSFLVPISKSNTSVKFLGTSKHNLLIIFLLSTLGLQVLILIQTISLNIFSFKLANRPVPSLVQLQDGNTVLTISVDSLERTPAVIKKFVGNTMALLFNWTGRLPKNKNEINEIPELDPGVVIGDNNQKITTAAYEASFGLSPDFRNSFLSGLASMIPFAVFEGKTETILLVSHLSEPTKIESGKWKIEMIASLLFFSDKNQVGEALSLNKEIYVRAIPPPENLQKNSSLQTMVNQVRASGLEIYLIKDL